MKEGQCIKCGSKDHIKKDCTAGWKPATDGTGKEKGKGKIDNKKVTVVQAADSLISEDKLDYECD